LFPLIFIFFGFAFPSTMDIVLAFFFVVAAVELMMMMMMMMNAANKPAKQY